MKGADEELAGVTTVRNLGNDNAALQQMIDETAADDLLWPHIVPCGFLEGASPFSSRNAFVVKTVDEADGDPTTNIGDLRKVALVITQGKLISPAAVYHALGVKPFVSEVPGVEPIANVAAKR